MLSRDVLRAWCYALILSMGLNVSAGASVGTLVRTLLKGVENSGIVDMMVRKGVDSNVAGRVGADIHRALTDLSDGAVTTEAALRGRLNSLDGMEAEDIAARARIVGLLDREASTLSKQDWNTVANDLMYLSSRWGQRDGTGLTCGSCVDPSARENGFKYSFNAIQNERVQRVRGTLPNNPGELDNFIKTRMRSLGVGNFTLAEKRLVKVEERRALATFLGMAMGNSPANATERQLIDAIKEVSTRPDGTVRLLDADNPHSLWRLFREEGFNQTHAASWTQVLRETASAGKDQTSKREAFFAAMERRAKDPEGEDAVRSLRENNCYFQ